MRRINIIIDIEDNDHIENELFKTLDGVLGNNMIFTVRPDVTELYDKDANFRKLDTKLRECRMIYNNYIKRNN